MIDWDSTGRAVITLRGHEFTSLCPVTGQPDYAVLDLIYEPERHIVETKSFKLFLQRYRSVGMFNECIAREIGDAFFEQVKPHTLTLRGVFNVRGGVNVETLYERSR